MSDLPREVLKWLQSLDLSHQIKHIRRDFSNGYLIAEIFSWYFPEEIQMHSFHNGTSIETKVSNWLIIERFLAKEEYEIPREEIEGTIHCKPKAALLLVQRIYSILTNRRISSLTSDEVADFTDLRYQSTLPIHARSTASQAIKNNIANSELHTDPDRILCQQKAENVIRFHIENRQSQRRMDPERFGIKPNICDKRLPTRRENKTSLIQGNVSEIQPSNSLVTSPPSPEEYQKGRETPSVTQFKEIRVNQSPIPATIVSSQ